MTQPIALTVEAGLQAEQDLLATVCAGDQDFALLFWQPSDRALVMPRRLSRLPGFDAACAASATNGWPVLLRETGESRYRSRRRPSTLRWCTRHRAAKVITHASKPPIGACAIRFAVC